ncbi:type II CAAX prenyl endopeptidase Rce1 family protein [Butyrivibrio proteoclasticus]|uniref:CPBP family glutamic-type intramembrane protease n=1 Tax=Butyrivibrio proteoclasticus TaxID=43305 RepID=UPI000478CA55|nr:CPBP family glutamic-type intramembrane protease [Butyrivibrio proteoclasticus]
MKNENLSKKKVAVIFVIVTLLLTWLFQFTPIVLQMNVEETSVSSFDFASIFFVIGGMLPSLLGGIFVAVLYKKENIKDFFKRCLVPDKRSILAIFISLLLICIECFVTQTISKMNGGEKLGFEGLKLIAGNPLMFFYFLFWGLISGPFSEEFGWRGFLSDMVINKKNVVKGSIIIGLIWGIWHLPLFFYPAQIQYEWAHSNMLLAVCFVLMCVTNSLVYSSIYVISQRKVFPIFFLHMFENIVLTGAMIYPFSDVYKTLVNPVSIVLDIVFFVIITRTRLYKDSLEAMN